jgi:hypothetical protein
MNEEANAAARIIAQALYEPGENADVTSGLMFIGRAIDRLGNADAATPMGAIEAFGAVFKETVDGLSEALQDVARAIRAAAPDA